MAPENPTDNPNPLELNQPRFENIWNRLQDRINLRVPPREREYRSQVVRMYQRPGTDDFYFIQEYKSLAGIRQARHGILDPNLQKVRQLKYPIFELDPEITTPGPQIRTLNSSFGSLPEIFVDEKGNTLNYQPSYVIAKNKRDQIEVLRREIIQKVISETTEDLPKGPSNVLEVDQIVEADDTDLQNIEKVLAEMEAANLIWTRFE